MPKREPTVRIISEVDEKTLHLSPYKRQYRITDESDEHTVTTKIRNKIVSEREEMGWSGESDGKRIVSEREEHGWGGIENGSTFDGESSHLEVDEDLTNKDILDAKVSNDDYITRTNLSPNLNNFFDELYRQSNDTKASNSNSAQLRRQPPSEPGLENSKPIVSRVAPSKSKNAPKVNPSKSIQPYSPSDSDDNEQSHLDDFNDEKDWSASDIAKLSPDLQRLLGFEPNQNETDWQLPSKPGLANSQPIVSTSKSYSEAGSISQAMTKINSFPSSASSSIGFSNRPRLADDADDEAEGYVDSGGKGRRVWNNSKNIINDVNSFDDVIQAYNSYYQHALEAGEENRKHHSKYTMPPMPRLLDDSVPLVPDSGRRKYTQNDNSVPDVKSKCNTSSFAPQQHHQYHTHQNYPHHHKRDNNSNVPNRHDKAYWSTEEWNCRNLTGKETIHDDDEVEHDILHNGIHRNHEEETDFSSINMSPNLMTALGLAIPAKSSPCSKSGLDNFIIPTSGNSASGTGKNYNFASVVRTSETQDFQPARRKSYYDKEEEEVYCEGKSFEKALYGGSGSGHDQYGFEEDNQEADDITTDNHGYDLPSETMSVSLMKALGLDTFNVKPMKTDRKSPSQSGLDNSRPIGQHNRK